MRPLRVIAAVAALLLWTGTASAATFVEGNAGVPQPLVTFDKPAPAQAKITWGDGSPAETVAVEQAPDGTGSVSGAHAYAKHGSYQVVVEDAANPATTRSTTATVDDAPITAEGQVAPTAAAAGGVTLAVITDANPLGVPESLKASVDWGDGVVGDATIVAAGQPGRYLVQGAHAYPDGGTYPAMITISSNDGGTAQATAQSRFDGVEAPVAPVRQGKILDIGVAALGGRPSITVDDAGTAYVVWATPAGHGADDAIAFCRVPRGASGCDLRRTLYYKPFASTTTILRGPSGKLYIVAAHILTGRGGTVVLTSPDNGQTWGSQLYDVDVGIYQSAVSGAALSHDERAMYITYGPFFNLASAPLQGIARLDLTSNAVPWIGDESFQRRVVVGAGVLPDGRGVALANRHPDVKDGPLVALRVVGDAANRTTDSPWLPVNAANARKIVSTPNLASILDCSPVKSDPFATRIGAVPLRGLQGGTVRALGFLRSDNSGCGDADLAYDAAGGRHATYISSADGCPSGDDVTPGPGTSKHVCIVYRGAKPNADFRPKTILVDINPETKVGGVAVGTPQAVRVGAGRDGQGWVVWHSFNDRHIRMTPTRDDTEAPVASKHTIALKPLPNGECTNTDTQKVQATVGGPASGRPRILSVAWSTGRGVLPRRQTDRSAPFSITAKTDQRLMHNIGSTGTVLFGSLLKATVRYRAGGGAVKTARLQLPLTYFCSIKWTDVEKKYEKKSKG